MDDVNILLCCVNLTFAYWVQYFNFFMFFCRLLSF